MEYETEAQKAFVFYLYLSMKNISFFILFFFFISACSKPKEPEFQSVKNIELIEFTDENVVINANAIFHNPNIYSCTLESSDIDVIVNGINVGKAEQKERTAIPANADFSLPMQIQFPPTKIFNDKNSLINLAISALGGKKIDLQYKGSITISVLEIPFTVPVDYTDEIKLKRKK